MSKKLFIAEKPSVAKEFAKTLGVSGNAGQGYMESQDYIVTWCVGHLVTMSYPDAYDKALKKWTLQTLPFLPEKFLYELIPDVKKQFNIVAGLLNREDVSTIYVCTDSGREGEYIYRLVDQMAHVPDTKDKRRVWIDSQTEEEIKRGITEAKPLSEYDNLSASAYLRAKEDYLMGINFSRVLSLKYGRPVMDYLNTGKWSAISVGRVMTCVLGMVVRREREIREFVKTPFYRILMKCNLEGKQFEGEWRAVEGSQFYQSPKLYKENGFKNREDAEQLCKTLTYDPLQVIIQKVERKKERKNPPLLFNLAELQNTCSKLFKISPDETLKIVQELYERKLVTYPRTDARVLSTAVAKEIYKNIGGLQNYSLIAPYAAKIMEQKAYAGIAKSRYVNDKQITDHYAIIPTGQAVGSLSRISEMGQKVYDVIARRFLSIFMPPAVYLKIKLETQTKGEAFFANFKMLKDPGYLKVTGMGGQKKEAQLTEEQIHAISSLKKGMPLPVKDYTIKDGTTSAPKRYNSGSLILAMENAGQLIEDEDLREQIKGSGIGTSATRAEIVKKLVSNKYIALNKKTQIVTPTLTGEMIVNVVSASIGSLLNPTLTASWEKGLTYVAEGSVTEEEYMQKLDKFVTQKTNIVKQNNFQYQLRQSFDQIAPYYQKKK